MLCTSAAITLTHSCRSSRCHPCEWAYIDKLAVRTFDSCLTPSVVRLTLTDRQWIVYFLLGMITISDIVISATLCFFLGDQVRESHSNRYVWASCLGSDMTPDSSLK